MAIVTLVYREPRIVETIMGWNNLMPDIPIYVFCDGYDEVTHNALRFIQINPGLFNTHVEMTPERKGFPNAMRDAIKYMGQHHMRDFDHILYVDSDGCYTAEEIKAMIEFDNDSNICGYRVNREEADWYRRPYIALTPILMRLLFGFKMKDYTCAFRRMWLPLAYIAILKSRYSRWGFWMEFDAIWNHFGFGWTEMPVHFTTQPTKIFSLKKMPRILVEEFIAILRTKWNLWWNFEIK